jgi:hypothetical protein
MKITSEIHKKILKTLFNLAMTVGKKCNGKQTYSIILRQFGIV